jgi:carboxyl-terminal processing protease
MIRHIRTVCLLLALGFTETLRAQPSPTLLKTVPTPSPVVSATTNSGAPWKPATPGPADGRVAFVTASLLEQVDYLHRHFDSALSGEFMDRYLDTLDPQHLHFTQEDLNQFDKYRTNLDRLTLRPEGVGDPTPAYAVFNRFMQRLIERTTYAEALLKTDKFDFSGDERIPANRKDAPFPADLAAAHVLWRQHLRFEYLQEKLRRADSRLKEKNAAANAAKPPKSGPPKTEAEEIADTLTRNYDRTLRTFKDLTSDEVMETYLTSLAHVYDPHSDYMDQEELDSFNITMNLELFGIGAELHSEDGYCSIVKLVPGGPALKSQLIHENDRIVAVAQGDQPPVGVVGMNLTKIVQMIRGPKGTEVRLTVAPAGDDATPPKIVTLIRDRIKLEDQAARGEIIDLHNGNGHTSRLGVIDLPAFYGSMSETGDFTSGEKNANALGAPQGASADVARFLKKFKEQKVDGVILDLRLNGGGLLGEAVKLTGLFIKSGPVVQVRRPNGHVLVDDDDDSSVAYDGPLIVLTSHFSASASEIVTAALQDYGRALVVGDLSTFGKGTVQQIADIKPYMRPGVDPTNDPGALKVTVQKFYRVTGDTTELKGVASDIVLPSVLNYRDDVGEKSLENPLAADTIDSQTHGKLNLVQPYLATLLNRSNARVATNVDFSYIREDIQQFQKEQGAKTISLNESNRLAEMEEQNARLKARDLERLARKDPDQKVYELSLKLADGPGLPPPTAKTNSLAIAVLGPGGVAAGTNASLASNSPSKPDPAALPQTPDAAMDETVRILADYVALIGKPGGSFAGSVIH